jgi:hypothetical protein
VTDAHVCRLLPLTCPAPDIVEAILNGRQPMGLRLAKVLGNGPLVGKERHAPGFPRALAMRLIGRSALALPRARLRGKMGVSIVRLIRR